MPGFELIGEEEFLEVKSVFDDSGILFRHSFDNLRNGVFKVKDFESAFPNADLAGINQILEETLQALIRNYYTPLTLTNLLISMQRLLKGKETISIS